MNTLRHHTIRPSPRGPRFDGILLTEGSRCPFYTSQCHHCDIPTLSSGFPPAENRRLLVENIRRLDHKDTVKQANLFGTGNVLNPREISEETFAFSLATVRRSFPNLECFGVDTRPEIALSLSGISRITSAIAAIRPVRFELVIGYETQDELLRTSPEGLNKKITEQDMQRVFAMAQQYGLGLQINVMLMPVPTMLLSRAIDEAVRTIEHMADLQRTFGIPVLINLNPLYINQRMIEKWGSGILETPLPSHSEINEVLRRCHDTLPIFVGLEDDGLAIKKAYYNE